MRGFLSVVNPDDEKNMISLNENKAGHEVEQYSLSFKFISYTAASFILSLLYWE